MRLRHIATFLSILLASASCSKEAFFEKADNANEMTAMMRIVGTVTDIDSKPIEHIKVTFDWGAGTVPSVVYTSSAGVFSTAFIENWNDGGGMTLTVRFEDIDGDANGGTFETLEKEIMLNKGTLDTEYYEAAPVLMLDIFRLTHATASENIPQS